MIEALFIGAVTAIGNPADKLAQQAFSRLEKAYQGRPYHNLRHIENTLSTYLVIAEDLPTQTEAQIALALIYHDAVYDAKAKDNEALSAEMATRELSALGVSDEDCREIVRLILLTQNHQVKEGDLSGSIVVDADLAILQAPSEEYNRYAAEIRQEYAWVAPEAYRTGRTGVLERLAEGKLFTSKMLSEEAAKENIRREIAHL